MVNFKDMTAEQLLEPPPSYDTMVKTIKSRVKAKVKRAMPRIRGKVAELGKAKVAEKKAQAKAIKKAAGKMEGRVKEKKRVKAGKKEIIKGIKKIGANELAKKKAAGARIKAKASVAEKLPRIRGKVAELGKAKVAEKKKVGKKIKKKVKKNRKEFDTIEETPEYSMNSFNTGFEGNLNLGRTASRRRAFVGVHGLRFQDKRAIEYADAGDYPTEDIFVDSLTDTVINPETGNVVGTMYGGIFKPNVKLDRAYQTEMERRQAAYYDRVEGGEIDDDTDTDTDSELEVDEININGKMYYLDDSNGYIYDPETSERVPRQIELDYYNR